MIVTRPIDANALHMILVKMKDFGELTAKKAIRVVEKAPTVDAEPHWIPCSDAEPEHCHMVLISVYNAKSDMRFVDTGALYPEGWYGSGWKLPDYCLVTAWRELPKPYEVEE